MRVLVDTCVWSLALRRRRAQDTAIERELIRVLEKDATILIGPIRQELLTGTRDEVSFERVRRALASFPNVPLLIGDDVLAAKYANECRRQGIQGSGVDFLICAVAKRAHAVIFTVDKDFERYAKVLPIRLHQY
jgi:predicted nucleic acid-binding protein